MQHTAMLVLISLTNVAIWHVVLASAYVKTCVIVGFHVLNESKSQKLFT